MQKKDLFLAMISGETRIIKNVVGNSDVVNNTVFHDRIDNHLGKIIRDHTDGVKEVIEAFDIPQPAPNPEPETPDEEVDGEG